MSMHYYDIVLHNLTFKDAIVWVSEWVSELEYLKGAQKQKVTMRRSVT